MSQYGVCALKTLVRIIAHIMPNARAHLRTVAPDLRRMSVEQIKAFFDAILVGAEEGLLRGEPAPYPRIVNGVFAETWWAYLGSESRRITVDSCYSPHGQ